LHATLAGTLTSSLLPSNHRANPHYCRCVDKCLELEIEERQKLRVLGLFERLAKFKTKDA